MILESQAKGAETVGLVATMEQTIEDIDVKFKKSMDYLC